jgi:GT2 family glycosyltransferase
MISIITAVFGQLDMNRLFYESLEKYTRNHFELIILDNSSTDGSREYFESKGATIIPTGGNYSYPYCQNLGMQHASYDFLAFLNNDMILSPDWDVNAISVMARHGLEVASCCATDEMGDKKATRAYRKKWGVIKKVLLTVSNSYASLKLMHRIMFPDWEGYARKRFLKYGDAIVEGFAGCNIIAYKTAFEKIGPWDERIQAADFDTYIRTKKRSMEKGDIKPVHIMKGIYLHHYIRLTVKSKTAPQFTNKADMISFDQKWGKDNVEKYMADL